MTRQLATIQRIESIEPLAGYDRISKAQILGWEVTVINGEFQPGDFCVFAEPDSLFPRRPEFEFLAKYKWRIKARKVGPLISQGIALPLDILTKAEGVTRGWDGLWLWKSPTGLQGIPTLEGAEVTQMLGIIKHEIPEFDTGVTINGKKGKSRTAGNFPQWISKTDETRIQSVSSVLREAEGLTCYITTKCDGSSMTTYLKRNEETGEFTFAVCSRQQEKAKGEFCHFWYTAVKHGVEEKLRVFQAIHSVRFPEGIALQGELCGPGVQKNRMKLGDYEFFIFNVYNIATKTFLDFADFVQIVDELGLKTAPILNANFTIVAETNVHTLMGIANHRYATNPDSWAEGIVVRPLQELRHRKLGRWSFKLIGENFMLQYGL